MDGVNVVETEAIYKQHEEEHVIDEVDHQNQSSQEAVLLVGNAAHDDALVQFNEVHDFASLSSDPTRYCSPAASSLVYEYDIFISFMSEDAPVRDFVGKLHSALNQYGICAFINDRKLNEGKNFDEVYTAIKRSAIFVPVFSKGYAKSKWCLKEISRIFQCKRLMLPIFYDVEPMDVGNQTGPFEEAFSYHAKDDQDAESVVCWRHALKEAASLLSYVLHPEFDGREVDLLKVIVKQILKERKRDMYELAEHPVGVDAHVANMLEILNSRSQHEVLMVGIVGMGGIGKTTIAKSLFNQLSAQYDGSCLLLNTKDRWEQGQDILTRELLYDVLKYNVLNIGDGTFGPLQHKKVLLILDDVDRIEQLELFAGRPHWFGDGSRIIITTTDESVLIEHQIRKDDIYRPKLMTNSQSVQLFSHHAFHSEKPPPKNFSLSEELAATTGGLPLAIKVLGSEMFCHTDEGIWKEMLRKTKKVPQGDIQGSLRLSFNELGESQKSIFLDIACSRHIKENLQYATYTWDANRFFPQSSLKILEYKSLITVDTEKGTISIHDQLTDLGRAIAREEPRKRSRLWDPKETADSFHDNEANDKVEVIDRLDGEAYKAKADMRCMSKLRMLHTNGDSFDCESSTIHFPTSLQWLRWTDLPTDVLAYSELKNLCVLELEGKCLNYDDPIDPIKIKDPVFPQLKVLILKKKCFVVGRFDGMPCLEKLVMEEAYGLDKIHESIGHLKRLKFLAIAEADELKELPEEIGDMESLEHFDLINCTELSAIPCSIGKLKKLESLKLVRCARLIELPEAIGGMQSLRILDLTDCESLTKLPNSLGSLGNLQILDAYGCENLAQLPDSLNSLQRLEKLDLRQCNNLLVLPPVAGMIELLELDLGWCSSLTELPRDIEQLPRLEVLKITHCGFHALPPLPSSLTYLECEGCFALETLPEMSNLINLGEFCLGSCATLRALSSLPWSLTSLNCEQCSALETLPELSNLINLRELNLGYCGTLHALPSLPSSVTRLECKGCSALETLPEMSNLMNLMMLNLHSCSELQALPPLPSSLAYLDCEGCSALETLPDLSNLMYLSKLPLLSCSLLRALPPLPSSLAYLDCEGCSALETLPDLSNLTKLTHLTLISCRMLRALPLLPTSLESLECGGCSAIEILPELSNLTNLEYLSIYSCEMLRALPPLPSSLRWLCCEGCYALENLPEISNLIHLWKLNLCSCPKLRCLPPLPSSLMYLECQGCTALEILPELSTLGISTLDISSCEKLSALPPLPSSLMSLNCRGCSALQILPELSELMNLMRLPLHSCIMLRALPSLPSSLVYLECGNCSKLEFIPDISSLTDLYTVEIYSCKKLRAISTLPSSLELLYCKGCSALETLPNMSNATDLTTLDLGSCTTLRAIPPLPASLTYLDCDGCSALETLPEMANLVNLSKLRLGSCAMLRGLPPLPSSLTFLDFEGCLALETLPYASRLKNVSIQDDGSTVGTTEDQFNHSAD